MNRRLDKRTDSAHTADRMVTTATAARNKQAKPARTEHKSARATARTAAPKGVSMDYQMGFTSGPSV